MISISFLLYLAYICLATPELFADDLLFASNTLLPPDELDDGLLSYASFDENYGYDLEPTDGVNPEEMKPELSMFQPSDGIIQGQQVTEPYPDIIAGEEMECSPDDLLPAGNIRARGASCGTKEDPAFQQLRLPTLDNLPKKNLPAPSPLNAPGWKPEIIYDMPEYENPESCPMSFRQWYYVPVCGIRSQDPAVYTPTETMPLRGWTVTDATICERRLSQFEVGILARKASADDHAQGRLALKSAFILTKCSAVRNITHPYVFFVVVSHECGWLRVMILKACIDSDGLSL